MASKLAAKRSEPYQLIEPGTLTYGDIIGQADLTARLKEFGGFFASRRTTPGNILLTGEDGMGKATLATAFANELGCKLAKADAAEWELKGDFTAVILNLRPEMVVLLSNIQLLRRDMVSLLRDILGEFKLEITIGQGASVRHHALEVRPFTLIATCPKRSDCPPEVFNEFALTLSVKPYSETELQSILRAIANKAGIYIEQGVDELIVKSCGEQRPRCLESTLHRLTRAVSKSTLSKEDVQEAFLAFGASVCRGDALDIGSETFENISGIEFEHLVVKLLEKMGFHAETTKASGDGGIDIDAILSRPITGGRYLFQCKRYATANLIGAPTLRDFYGAVTAERAVRGVFITTSDFTVQALEFGEKAGLQLINGARLQELLGEFGLTSETAC